MVTNQFVREFYEIDASKKDKAWADIIIRDFRQYMEPLVDAKTCDENYSYLYGKQSMDKHKAKFKKPEELPFKFRSLGVFEKYRNILIAERDKAGIYINVNAIDPSAIEDKKNDAKLFKNRKVIEGVLSKAQQSMGMPPYSLANDKDDNGDKLFRGNVQLFDELGLNPQSAEDIAYFFRTFFRLDTEIEAEQIINYFVKYHELHEYIKMWCDDVLAVKAIAGRVYTNEFSCTPSYKYIKPKLVKLIKGNRADGKDAKAKMIEENITINDFVAMVGCSITALDIDEFMTAANWIGKTAYDGVEYSNGTKYPSTCQNSVSYDQFMNLKINVGYVEWQSFNADAAKVGKNRKGNFRSMPIEVEREVSEKSGYKKEVCWEQKTYKAYFVSTSNNTQKIYKFGELFGMVTDGPEDEYSSYSIQTYKYAGPSAIEIAIPHIDNIHDAWFRFNWILNKAKPKGTRYNYTAIAAVAKKMFRDQAEANAVMSYVKQMQDSIDDFYVNDTSNPNLGGGQNPHFEKPNGIDNSIQEFAEIIKAQKEEIADKLGINAIREAYSPNPNDGYKLQMQALAQSRNATEYMSRMIMSLLINYGIHTVQIVQNLIEHRSSRYYRTLERALGKKSLETLGSLKRVPLHKFGIFIDSFNTDIERQQQKQMNYQAWQNKDIDYKTFILLDSIDNPKKQAQILAYELKKAEDQKRIDAQQAHNNMMQLEDFKHSNQMELEGLKGDKEIEKQEKANEAILGAKKDDVQGKIIVKKMAIDAEPGKNLSRADAKVREKQAISNIENSSKTIGGE
jgi:hypothetical protein